MLVLCTVSKDNVSNRCNATLEMHSWNNQGSIYFNETKKGHENMSKFALCVFSSFFSAFNLWLLYLWRVKKKLKRICSSVFRNTPFSADPASLLVFPCFKMFLWLELHSLELHLYKHQKLKEDQGASYKHRIYITRRELVVWGKIMETVNHPMSIFT